MTSSQTRRADSVPKHEALWLAWRGSLLTTEGRTPLNLRGGCGLALRAGVGVVADLRVSYPFFCCLNPIGLLGALSSFTSCFR